ncbi:hypothetical protein WI28_16520 [Burkholderia diffusa]|nr:hypothetical protein WI28_16520 [Burkholderia diffusa]
MKFHTVASGETFVVERAELIAVARPGEMCGGCAFHESEIEDDCFEHACFAQDFPEGHPMRSAQHRIIWVRKD